MSDILRLDPFQMVRSFTVPEQEDVVVFDRCFQLVVSPPQSTPPPPFDVDLCDGGTTQIDLGVQWRYDAVQIRIAGNELYEGCENLLPMTLVGRNSGARWDIPWDRKFFLGYPQCHTEQCYVITSPGNVERWYGQNTGGLVVIVLSAFTSSDRGFADGEFCDIELRAPPRIPIAEISDAFSFRIYVDTQIPHEFPAAFQNVLIQDTGNPAYDAGWTIQSIESPTRIRIGRSFQGSVINQGTIERYYAQL